MTGRAVSASDFHKNNLTISMITGVVKVLKAVDCYKNHISQNSEKLKYYLRLPLF